ncbi:MAG: hydantoinase/oxoprolinase family protein [Alphaproteobacteria bacterium]|nr:hydantoinase/oxoprolinase family protein [Alphaproteobacteria bacterium]
MIQIGVDIGGTFTDLVLWDDAADSVWVHKLASTPHDPSEAAVAGIVALCDLAGIRPADVGRVFHGTTVATNILIERSGAKVGLITTKGFRDVLYIGRKKRPLTFSNYQDVPWQTHPLVKRRHRLGVEERVAPPKGEVVVALDEKEAIAAIRKLKAAGVESVAVCFLFSFLNPRHEKRVKALLKREFKEAFLSTSHEVVPLYREYERFATTCLNAYVGPKTARYIDRFAQALRYIGLRSELRLMSSAGGVVTADGAKLLPVSLLLSGPAAGLISGIASGVAAGTTNVITLDVGGTSADIGVAPNGELREKHLLDTRIRDYDAMMPMADIDTIGAGGGSIAYVDPGGMFRVGPRSAGAVPGPVCYGRGGTEPTVTDALVAVRWLRAEGFHHAGLTIDAARGAAAIADKLAKPLGLGIEEAALGVLRIVAHNMVEAITLNSIRKGFDPRHFVLVALGGAGPVFAVPIARELGIPKVIVPPHPGVGAAMGLLCSDVSYTFQGTLWENLARPNLRRIDRSYEELEERARRRLGADGYDADAIAIRRRTNCRYVGQGYELTVEAPHGPIDNVWVSAVVAAFHALHEGTYRRRFADKEVQLINLGVVGTARRQRRFVPATAVDAGGPRNASSTAGDALFPTANGFERAHARYYDRGQIKAGDVIEGAAIIEQLDATTVLPPGSRAEADRAGNLIVYP